MLIIPIMRRRSLDPLTIMTRERFLHSIPSVTSFLNIEANSAAVADGSARFIDFSERTQNQAPIARDNLSLVNADPFVTPEHSVFDIRIKRIIEATNDSSHATSHIQKSPQTNELGNGWHVGIDELGGSKHDFHEIGSAKYYRDNNNVNLNVAGSYEKDEDDEAHMMRNYSHDQKIKDANGEVEIAFREGQCRITPNSSHSAKLFA